MPAPQLAALNLGIAAELNQYKAVTQYIASETAREQQALQKGLVNMYALEESAKANPNDRNVAQSYVDAREQSDRLTRQLNDKIETLFQPSPGSRLPSPLIGGLSFANPNDIGYTKAVTDATRRAITAVTKGQAMSDEEGIKTGYDIQLDVVTQIRERASQELRMQQGLKKGARMDAPLEAPEHGRLSPSLPAVAQAPADKGRSGGLA